MTNKEIIYENVNSKPNLPKECEIRVTRYYVFNEIR